jgi:hypothetical protein
VVTLSRPVARWAEQPIELGPGSVFQPVVLGPDRIPRVVDPREAGARPEVAVLSLLAHRHADEALPAAAAALQAVAAVDQDQAAVYYDMINQSLDAVAQRALELLMNIKNYEFRSPTFRPAWLSGRQEGRQEGLHEGLTRALALHLRLRFGTVPDDFTERAQAADPAQLEQWIEQVLTADTAQAVFEDPPTPSEEG